MFPPLFFKKNHPASPQTLPPPCRVSGRVLHVVLSSSSADPQAPASLLAAGLHSAISRLASVQTAAPFRRPGRVCPGTQQMHSMHAERSTPLVTGSGLAWSTAGWWSPSSSPAPRRMLSTVWVWGKKSLYQATFTGWCLKLRHTCQGRCWAKSRLI